MKRITAVGRALMDGYVYDSAFFRYLEMVLGDIPERRFYREITGEQASQLADLIGKESLTPGGSCFNTLSVCCDDIETGFVFCVGDDELGELYLSGATGKFRKTYCGKSDKKTGMTFVIEDQYRRAALFYYGASDDTDPFSCSHDVLESDFLYSEGYVFTPKVDEKIVRLYEYYSMNSDNGINIINLGGFSNPEIRKRMGSMSELIRKGTCNIVIGNENEYINMKRDLGKESERFPMLGKDMTIITLGGKGSMGLDGERMFRRGAAPVGDSIVIGAGDAFSGGFIKGLSLDCGIQDCMEMGYLEAEDFVLASETERR